MKTTYFLFAGLMLLALCGEAAAQCGFNHPSSNLGIRATMVRSFTGCPASLENWNLNTETKAGTDACEPVAPVSVSYDFAESTPSGCSVRLNKYKRPSCGTYVSTWIDGGQIGLPAEPCQLTRVRVRCQGIQKAGAAISSPVDDGFQLYLRLRLTLKDAVSGPMTVDDRTVSIPLPIVGGELLVDTSLQKSLALSPNSPTFASLPICTTNALVEVKILDPAGLPFAEIGLGTH